MTHYVPESRDLAEVLFEGAGEDGLPAMRSAGELVRLLHEKGVHHPDLNLKNILISADHESPTGKDGVRALILDLDRARLGRTVGERARRRMLERFWRSARKFEERTGKSLGSEMRGAFEVGYGG